MWTRKYCGKYNKAHALGHASRMHTGNNLWNTLWILLGITFSALVAIPSGKPQENFVLELIHGWI